MPAWYFDDNYNTKVKQALLIHEIEHVAQWDLYGWTFILNYLFEKEIRKDYEMSAYKKQIQYLKLSGVHINIESWAKMISSMYSILNFISFEKARQEIENWVK